MKLTTLSSISQLLNATHYGDDIPIQSVSTDSRTIQPGDLFVALVGEHFDGHDYLAQAHQHGAAAAMVSRQALTTLPTIHVQDTRLALGQMASVQRREFNLPIVAVTGSSGKTTVKEMIAAIFKQAGPTLATQGNLNNDIGVPLTLLKLSAEHTYAVIEMGANHPGEIAYVVGLTQPSAALITNVAPAHLAGFGSVEGVARAKGEIYQGLTREGIAVMNADDPFSGLWQASLEGRRCLTFGIKQPADFYATHLNPNAEGKFSFILHTPVGETVIQLPLPGQHNVMNALAAAAATAAVNIALFDIKQGLESVAPVKGRLLSREGIAGARVIDDTYNANPGSVQAALNVLAQCAKPRILVLGDMGELGDYSEHYHTQIGQQARELGIENLFACGALTRLTVLAFGTGGYHFADRESLIEALRPWLQTNMTVLVKGSRSAKMESVVAALLSEHAVSSL